MKTVRGGIKSLLGIAAIAALSLGAVSAQNTLQFTGVKSTVEGAIQLYWASNSNEVYEVDFADSLIDTNTGTITWQTLYTDIPSQGTNSFIGDFGNYFLEPPILHPNQMPMRFYRIFLTGTNTAPTPAISITSPGNGAELSSNVTVTVSTSGTFPITTVKLYVDGQEMPPSPDGTNFVINTSEWPNGAHTLFATVKTESDLAGIPNVSAFPVFAEAASPYLNVTFDNLITRFAFSQAYFDPSIGQTQTVSAVFAANVNWTLQIQDESFTTVRTVTGSGGTMSFNWDGTGDGGVSIPNGVYTYFLSAQTNGAPLIVGGGGGGSGGPPPSPMSASTSIEEPTELWAMPSDGSGSAVPLILYPPGMDTNSLTIFEAPADFATESASAAVALSGSINTANGAGPLDANTPLAQASRAPTRPPIAPIKGFIGTCGMGYQTYVTASGTFQTPPILNTPPPIPTYVALDGRSQAQASLPETWGPIPENKDLGNSFITGMKAKGWKPTIIRTENNISGGDLTGGTFNQCNVALLSLHSSYATTSELDGIYHTYIRFLNNGSPSYVKTDSCSFGGSGTNGLKWLGLLTCNLLRDQNYSSMYDAQVLPINNDLHLLLSTSTFATAAPDIGKFWAGNMLGTLNTNAPAETVMQAWFDAGSKAYTAGETNHLVITFRVAGWPGAFSEHLSDVNNTPGTGNPADITKQDQTVFNNP